MTTINPVLGRLVAAVGGALLIAAMFLPWADYGDATTRSGWQALAAADVLLAITGLLGLAAAATGGRFGFFRPDLSLNATADILAFASAVVVGWWLAFDVPNGASAAAGSYVGLVATIAVMCGAGDFRVSSLFPRLAPARGERSR